MTRDDFEHAIDAETVLGEARRLVEAREAWPVPPERAREHEALVTLLVDGRSSDAPVTEPLAETIAAACLAPGHLWRALGLRDRSVLGALLDTFFGELARHNTMDMRWKRFFYKRLCGWEGFHH
jgi:nitrogen fixation protein NifQ